MNRITATCTIAVWHECSAVGQWLTGRQGEGCFRANASWRTVRLASIGGESADELWKTTRQCADVGVKDDAVCTSADDAEVA